MGIINRKKLTLSVAGLLVLFLMFSGCGIAQEEYDGAAADEEHIQAQTADVRSQIEEIETETADVATQISEQESAYPLLEQELAALEAENGNLKSAIASAEIRLDEKKATLADLQAEGAALKERIPILDYAIMEDADAGFSVNYPKSWQYERTDEAGILSYIFEDGGSGAFMTVSREDAGGMGTRAFFESFLNAIEDEYGNDYLFIGEAPGLTGGQLGIQASYSIKETQANQKACFISIVVKGSNAWKLVLECDWADFTEMAFMFNEMLDSFSLD